MLFRSDRKSTRLNSSHTIISYAVFCLKKKERRKHIAENRISHVDAERSRCGKDRQEAFTDTSPVAFNGGVSLQSGFFLSLFFLMMRRPPEIPLFPNTAPSR